MENTKIEILHFTQPRLKQSLNSPVVVRLDDVAVTTRAV